MSLSQGLVEEGERALPGRVLALLFHVRRQASLAHQLHYVGGGIHEGVALPWVFKKLRFTWKPAQPVTNVVQFKVIAKSRGYLSIQLSKQ
jgi:hypothetical protein